MDNKDRDLLERAVLALEVIAGMKTKDEAKPKAKKTFEELLEDTKSRASSLSELLSNSQDCQAYLGEELGETIIGIWKTAQNVLDKVPQIRRKEKLLMPHEEDSKDLNQTVSCEISKRLESIRNLSEGTEFDTAYETAREAAVKTLLIEPASISEVIFADKDQKPDLFAKNLLDNLAAGAQVTNACMGLLVARATITFLEVFLKI